MSWSKSECAVHGHSKPAKLNKEYITALLHKKSAKMSPYSKPEQA